MTSKESEVEIQDRDVQILLGLFECRVMSLRHVTDLYFNGKSESAKKRIQKLKAGGFLRERPRAIGDPSILHLSSKSFDVLRESGRLDGFPPLTKDRFERRSQLSEFNLRHELAVMDVRCAMTQAIRNAEGLSLTEFSTWPALFEFTAQVASSSAGRKEVLMKPDGFLRVRQEEPNGVFEHMFFLELDRSTESQDIIAQKAAAYLDFYQSGGMARRFGGSREEFRDFPFRVLMIFRNEERRNNAAERLLQNTPPILTHAWLSTIEEVIASPIRKIWIRPKDYLSATSGTRFEPRAMTSDEPYRRRTERELLVSAKVVRKELWVAIDRPQSEL